MTCGHSLVSKPGELVPEMGERLGGTQLGFTRGQLVRRSFRFMLKVGLAPPFAKASEDKSEAALHRKAAKVEGRERLSPDYTP